MTQPSATVESRVGRYAVHAEIGAGGMATVHLGRLVGARGFSRTVAIKVLHASYAKNKEFVERFLDEARLVGRIHHPNVMPTLDVIAEGPELRIVMDYVAGESLDQLWSAARAKGERVPTRIACGIVSGVLHGLHAAHEAKNEFGEPLGIVHLDVSPQNILVGVDGTSRVLDFGVARARGAEAATEVSGKSAYLSPEQVRGVEVSPRTDVFAASIVLWELLTGEPLFLSDNHAATLQRVLGGVIPSAADKVPDLPPRIDELLKIGLRRDPGQRFATARDMALEIEAAIIPALPSEIGRWVESIASETLAARALLVREMESSAAGSAATSAAASPKSGAGKLPGLVATRDMYEEMAAVNLPSEDLEDDKSSSLLKPPGGKDAVPQRVADGSIRWQQRATAPKPAPLVNGRPVARAQTVTRTPKPKSPINRTLLGFALGGAALALIIFAFAARSLLLPSYVRSTAIATAAAHGVTLTVGDAALEGGSVTLRGLTARLAGVPQATATIATAEVASVFSSPARVVLGKTEVVVDGDAKGVMSALTTWSSAHRGKVQLEDEAVGGQIEMPNAHLVWTHVSPDVMRVEATGLSGAIGSPSSASLGDDVHFLTNALAIETKQGGFGPWNLTFEMTVKATRVRLALDPAVPDGANALLVDDALGDSSFDIQIPRLATASLGIPRTAFGPDLPFPQQLEVALHYGRLNRDQASATLKASMYGLRIPELGASVETHLTAEATGPTGGAMTVKNGLFTLGALHAGVTGTVTPYDHAVKGQLAWKGETIPCASLVALPSPGAAAQDLGQKAASGDLGDLGQLARDLGAIGQAVGAVKITGAFTASGTVVFDTGDLAHAKWTTNAKNACGLALFQAK